MGIEGAKGNEHGGINSYGVIEECAYHILHKVDVLRGQQGGVFSVVGVLGFGAVGRGFPVMGCILWVMRLGVLGLV